ncbi:MAG: (4Fe-4S)-binding protein [Bacteroidota bacterium]|nr:(4Fe-4S)-binding protein [Bacteroidota bacterium]
MESRSNTVTATISQVPFTTKIVSGKHIIMADEPIDHGGADQGMTPYDLLLAALCSCTSITIKMYATRKGWMLSNVIVDATMERTVEGGNQITKVTQTLSFEGDLDDTMKNRLLEIGGRCPVHKTLAPAIQNRIYTKVVKDITKHYSNGEMVIVWQPSKCAHSGICFRGMPRVFDTRVKPWINMENAETAQIQAQIAKCPSGALSIGIINTAMPENTDVLL